MAGKLDPARTRTRPHEETTTVFRSRRNLSHRKDRAAVASPDGRHVANPILAYAFGSDSHAQVLAQSHWHVAKCRRAPSLTLLASITQLSHPLKPPIQRGWGKGGQPNRSVCCATRDLESPTVDHSVVCALTRQADSGPKATYVAGYGMLEVERRPHDSPKCLFAAATPRMHRRGKAASGFAPSARLDRSGNSK